MFGFTSSVNLTASGQVLGSTGIRIRLFSVNIKSAAGAQGVVTFRNGSDTGTIYMEETGASSGGGKTVTFGRYGMLFDNGLYVELDANTEFVTVEVLKEV